MSLNIPLVNELIAELESGRHIQGKGRLQKLSRDGEITRCCLGVLCEMKREEFGGTWRQKGTTYSFEINGEEERYSLPREIADAIGLNVNGIYTYPDGTRHEFRSPSGSRETSLANLNDCYTESNFTPIVNELRRLVEIVEKQNEAVS